MSLTPEGNYKANLAGMVFGESSKGTPQIEFIVDVQVSTNDPRRRSIILYFTPKVKDSGKTVAQESEETLEKFGFNGKPKEPWCKVTEFEVYCRHEEYEGKMRERWNFSSGSRTRPATNAAMEQFEQRWRAGGRQTATVAPPAAPTTPPAASKGPPPEDDAPKGKVWDKNAAWDAWCAEFGEKVDSNQWNAAIQKVGKGRRQAQFTAADWEQVASLATLPF